MVRICSFKKHGSYEFIWTNCTLRSCERNFINCMRIFITHETVTVADYVPTLCTPNLVQEKYKFFYFYFVVVQLWTHNSNIPLFCMLFSYMASMRRDLFYKTSNYIFLWCIYRINTANDHCCSTEWKSQCRDHLKSHLQ
jgi:hypothetical protein